MTSVVQHGRRRGSSKSGSSSTIQPPPDLRQVTVLSKAEWLRIQDELKQVNKEEESMREVVKQREDLHLRSQEVVKLWSNTIAGQRQKKLEAKKIREQKEEEKRKQTDEEEAKYKEEKRKEVVAKAKTQLYYQTHRVKELHRALLLTEVLKEREAQIELKQRMKGISEDRDQEYAQMVKTKEEEAERREQEEAKQRRLQRQVVAEDLNNQIKESERARELEKLEMKKDREEIQHLQELHQWEQRAQEEANAKQKRKLLQDHLEDLSDRDIFKATEARKLEAEEEQRKLFLSARQKMMKMRRDKEEELFHRAQTLRENILDPLSVSRQQQTADEEQRTSKAVAEQDAKQAQLQRDEEERRAQMLRSIAAHREHVRQEKEQRERIRQQNELDTLQAKKEADRIFTEKQRQKAQRNKEEEKKVQNFNATQKAERSARERQLKWEEQQFEAMNTQLVAEEEREFQKYSSLVISAAAGAQRNVFPLCKAAREGMGGGRGPSLGGVRPSYIAQDSSGAQLPSYASDATQIVKKIHEVEDIQEAKRRLGFTW